jgi:putative redox protein
VHMPGTITVHARQIAATTTEGDARGHTVLIDRTEVKGGANQGMMGGEMLLAALAGCFLSNVYAAIIAREAPVSEVEIEVVGQLVDNPQRYEHIDLHIQARFDDAELMQKLVTIAERACIVANTLRPGVELAFHIQAKAAAG